MPSIENASGNKHKEAVHQIQQIQQIQQEVSVLGGNASILVGDIMDNLLNGVLAPEEALRRAKLVQQQLPNTSM